MQLDRYEVQGEIARGGFGVVYRAWDPTLQREVAIKVLLDDRDPDEVERFLREGQAATRIRHANVLRILGGGSAEGRPYLVMELVEGPTLAARIAREREGLLVAEAVDLVVELASGLESAHQAGVLHRDLKPENVLFLEGRPLLTDFGIARLADARSLTQTGELLGTPGYMAPEQIEGDRARLGPPTDVYGLGAILYASLTGRAPFEGPTLLATLDQVLRTSPSPPSTHRAEVDRRLDAICLRALAREPGERYASAAEFAAALEGWATPDPASERSGGPALAIVAVLFLLAGGLAAGAWSLSSAPPEEAPAPTGSRSPAPSLAVRPSVVPTPSASAPTPLPSDTPPARSSREAAELLARGRAAIERDLDEAMLLLSQAALDPATQQAARVEQALVQVKRRRLRAAQGYLDATAGKPAPTADVARANYVAGRLLYELGQKAKSHALFQKAVKRKRSGLYLAWLGITAPSKARAPLLAEASALAPEDPAVLHLELLCDLTYTKSPPVARALLLRFEAALEEAPLSPYLAFYAPRLRWYAGDVEGALESGRATLEAWPSYRNPYREAGWILSERSLQVPPLERGRYLEEARRTFEEGLKHFPQDVALTRERAWLFVRMGQLGRAVEAHEQLLSFEVPGKVSAWSLHNTYLAVQQFFLHAVQSRDLQGVQDAERAGALGQSVLDQMAATGYLRTRSYGKTAEVEALTRTDLRLLLGRVLGIQRRWQSAARVLSPEIARGPRQGAARYLHYLNREEEALYSLRPQRPLEELNDEWNALFLSGHRAGIAESLEAKAVRKLPLPSQEFIDRVKGMRQVALRLELCDAISADPYRLEREAAIRARVVRADPGNLLAWHALLRQLLRHERTVSALQAIAAMPEAIAQDPLILALKGEVLSANALVTGKDQEEQFAKAEAAFKQALAQEPRFEAVTKALLEHDLRRARPLRARRAFDELAERLPAAERERLEAEVLRLEKEER